MRVLALDVGKVRTGYCLSDKGRTIPAGGGIITGSVRDIISQIEDIVKEKKVSEIVVGYPISTKNVKTEQTKYVNKTIEKLRSKLNIPVIEVDERFSTKEAMRILHSIGGTSKNKNKLNEISARVILETYLKSSNE